jgi:hypothetical protein
MWVKLTPNELAKAKRRRKRKRLITSIFATVFAFLMVAFTFGQWDIMARGIFFIPAEEISQHIPVAVLGGVFTGLLIYFAQEKKKPTVVCTKCGIAKIADISSKCECGGHFENIEEMKWHENKK